MQGHVNPMMSHDVSNKGELGGLELTVYIKATALGNIWKKPNNPHHGQGIIRFVVCLHALKKYGKLLS